MRALTCVIALAACMVVPPRSVVASITEQGSGFVHGKNHLFTLTAPPGWVIDNESGLSQGVVAVFYPKGGVWGKTLVACYSRSSEITGDIRTPDDVAQRTIRDFHAHGSPGYQGRRVKVVRSKSGAQGVIWHFHGDAWGNYEAGAYFPAKKRINAVIFTARTKADFERGLPAFETLARSYDLLSEVDDPTPLLKRAVESGAPLREDPTRSLKSFEQVATLAHDMGETPEGKAFERATLARLGQVIANAAGVCLARAKTDSEARLVLIFDAGGRVMAARHAETDEAARCLAGKLRGKQAVRPPKPEWMMLFKFSAQDQTKPRA